MPTFEINRTITVPRSKMCTHINVTQLQNEVNATCSEIAPHIRCILVVAKRPSVRIIFDKEVNPPHAPKTFKSQIYACAIRHTVGIDQPHSAVYDAVVDSGGNGDFTTLREACEAGRQSIFMRNGTYREPGMVRIPTKCTLQGESAGGVQILFNDGGIVCGSIGDAMTSSNQTYDGTVTCDTPSFDVIGNGTNFTKFQSGYYITFGGHSFVIGTIIDDTHLTLTRQRVGAAVTDVEYTVRPYYVAVTIRNLTVVSGSSTALALVGLTQASVENVALKCNNVGLCVLSCSDISISQVASYDNDTNGVVIQNCCNISLSQISSKNNASSGVNIVKSHAIAIDRLDSSCNGLDGLSVDKHCSNVRVINSNMRYNYGAGVRFAGTRCQCACNAIEGNRFGVVIDGNDHIATSNSFLTNTLSLINMGDDNTSSLIALNNM